MRVFLFIFFVLLSSPALAFVSATMTVNQVHGVFDTDAITVNTGSTVIFENKDTTVHNLQILDGNGNNIIDKGLQEPGDAIKQTFSKAGVYVVRCALQPKMKMKVIVQ